MCRLLGIRASNSLQLSRELLSAPNALRKQSLKHPDGWGIASFSSSGWRLKRGVDPALRSSAFAAAARSLDTEVAIAHVRKASVGGLTVANTHPFVHEGWAFAHNGTVQGFETRRAGIERAIAPSLRKLLQGETDSERLFLLFLTNLRHSRVADPLDQAANALARVASHVLTTDPPGLPKPSSVNVLCSDGDRFLALRLNRTLGYATGASPRATPARTGQLVDQVLVASEPTGRNHRWRRLANGAGFAVDSRLRLTRFRLA